MLFLYRANSCLDTDATWCMEQVPTALPQEVGIKPACRIHRSDTDDYRPLKLIRP